jgi:hypothetical protein
MLKVSEYINQVTNMVAFGQSKSLPTSNTVTAMPDNNTSTFIGGAVDVKEVSMLTNSNEKINLIGYFNNITVEENIFSSAINGKISMADTEGALEKFAIHGGETLQLKIVKPGTDNLIIWRQDLVVTKITRNDVTIGNYVATYDMFFTSKSHINSMKKNLFKSYKQTTLAEAVYQIYREMSSNDVIIEDPKVTLNVPFISTGVPPHKTIDYLAQRACSKNKYFVFFERFVPVYGSFTDGNPFSTTHYFGSVEKLIADSEISGVQTIAFIPKTNANVESTRIRAGRYERLDNFNHVPGMMLGFYNTTVSAINPITRNYNVNKLSYTDSDVETTDFYENKLFASTNIFNNYDDVKNETPGRKLIVSGMSDSINRADWLNSHIYGSLSKTMFKILVEIQGGTNTIGVGHVVNFVTPSAVSVLTNAQSSTPEIDAIYSGKYLVTSVVHSITGTTYTKSMQLSRGSSLFNFDKNTTFDATFDFLKQELRESLGNRRQT